MTLHDSFPILIQRLVRSVLREDSFYSVLEFIGCDTGHWPAGPAKAILVDYTRYRLEGGHGFAIVRIGSRGDELDDTDLPGDPEVLKGLYFRSLMQHKANELRLKLLNDPDNVITHVSEFKAPYTKFEPVHLGIDLDRLSENLEKARASGNTKVIVPGFELLSEMIGGFNPERVGMLVAKTGFGKTTCAINIAHRAANIMPVLYLNMEMSEQDFAERTYCSIIGCRLHELAHYLIDDVEKKEKLRSALMKLPLFFTQGKTMSAMEIFSNAISHKEKHGLGMLIVDYDQKIEIETSKETPEWKALQVVMEKLDQLSKRLQCFILLLAQEGSDGDVSGSRRSKYPASCAIRFFEDESEIGPPKYVLKTIKNRFGRNNQEIEVRYESDKYRVDELKQRVTSPQQKPMGERARPGMAKAPYPTRRDTHGD